jgi:tetratricopeptide (TPR) repeat protein
MLRFIFLLFTCSLFHPILLAQNKQIDSLINLLSTQKEDTTKVNLFLTCAEKSLEQGEYNKAILFCEQGLTLSQKLGFKKGLGNLNHRLGSLYIDKSNYEKALKHLLEAVRIREHLKDDNNLARSLSNIGALYQDRKDYKQALLYSQKALAIFLQTNDKYPISLLKGNIGHLYTLNKDYDNGLRYLQEALELKKELNDLQGLTYVYNYIGHNYIGRKSYPKALNYYLEALAIEEKYNQTFLMVASYANISDTYFRLKDYKNSRQYAEKALKSSQKVGAKLQMSEIYLNFFRLDSAQSNHKSALEWYKKSRLLTDSLNNIESNKRIAELQTTFEVAQKENEIIALSKETQIQKLELKQQNWLLIALLCFVLISVFISYFFYRNRQLKAQFALLDSEQRWRRSQMNPHFFFNALSAIQRFVMQADTLKATSYIAKFAKLMRQVLEQSQDEFTTLAEEIETIRNYIQLQQLRFVDKFDYELEISEDLDLENTLIPSMFTQPIIENAIEHGLKPQTGKGLLKISIKPNENNQNSAKKRSFTIEIDDNGVGKQASEDKKLTSHRSFATQIMAERIALLNKQKNINIRLETVEKPNQAGVIVRILLPL